MCLFYTQISGVLNVLSKVSRQERYQFLSHKQAMFYPVAALESRAAKRGRDRAKRIKHPLIIAMLKLFIES